MSNRPAEFKAGDPVAILVEREGDGRISNRTDTRVRTITKAGFLHLEKPAAGRKFIRGEDGRWYEHGRKNHGFIRYRVFLVPASDPRQAWRYARSIAEAEAVARPT